MVHNERNGRGGKVFLRRKRYKFVRVLGLNYYRHSFLRFGNGKLGTRQTLIFFGDFIKEYVKPVRKLAYGDGHAACAEVVALFNHFCRAGIEE